MPTASMRLNAAANGALKLLETGYSFPKVRLVAPNGNGYLLLAAVVDRRPPFAYRWESASKWRLLAALARHASELRAQ